jgi:diguanylate cyclase (GGDEF)-like protein
MDALSMPDPLRKQVLLVRVCVLQPMLLLVWVATYQRAWRDHLQWIGALAALGCGLGVAAIIGLARYHAYTLPYEGIILGTVFFYFLAGLRAVTAVICGWLVFLGYVLMELSIGMAGEVLLSNALFLALANVVGSVGSYSLEYATRQSFLAHGILQDLAEKDYLTGLFNRRAFTECAERSWKQAQRDQLPVGVVMMDVDFFKRYNDHYGHAAGDEALRQIARVIDTHARRPLDCTARYGGEEFVGLWYGLDEAQMLAILQDIRQDTEALGLSHAYSDTASVVTLSIGMAYLVPQPQQHLADALQLADAALYQAKQQGRNCVVSRSFADQGHALR